MILDTSFIIDFLNGMPNAVSKMQSLIVENIDYAIAAPTIFELWSGLVTLDKSNEEKSKTITLLGKQTIYPLDKKSAEEAGKIDGELIKKGLRINPEDSMIAGIGKVHNKKILTKDEHFSRIEGLKIETY